MEREELVLIEWPAYWLLAEKGEEAVKSNTMYAVGRRMPDGSVRVLIPCASGKTRAEELIAQPHTIENAMAKNCHASFVSRALKIDFMADGGPGQPQIPPKLQGEKQKPATPPFRKDPVAEVGLGRAFTEAQNKIAQATPAPAPVKAPAKKTTVPDKPLF